MGAIKRITQRAVNVAWYMVNGQWPTDARSQTSGRGFDAAGTGNLMSSWSVTPQPINVDIRTGIKKLVARSRHEAQNNDHMKNFLRLAKTNIVGHTGITLQGRIKDPSGTADTLANEAIEAGWREWGRQGSPEVTGMMSWRSSQRLFVETLFRDGEVLIRKLHGWKENPHRFAFEFLDNQVLDTELNKQLPGGNVIKMGVELNEWRRPVAYHLLTSKPNAHDYYGQGKSYQRIEASEIIHAFLPEWVWQTRGIPGAVTALFRFNMLSGYEEAELVAARVAAAKMGFFEEKDDETPPLPGDSAIIGSGEKDADGNFITDAEAGTFERLPRGYTVKTWDPQHPNAGFGDFVKAMLRGAASGLGVGYNTLANDPEGVNYTSLRHFALNDRDVWMSLQDWMVEVFCEPMYREWLSTALLTGELTVAGRPLRADREKKYQAIEWQPRRWAPVDPVKESAANEKEFNWKTRSPQQVIRERGGDPKTVLEDWKEWQEQTTAAGLTLGPKASAAPAPPENTTEDDDDEKENDDKND